MKTLALISVLALAAGTADAGCYADYKAKRDAPLKLHYGVAEVSGCSKEAAAAEIAPRLKRDGWTLLTVVSVFGDDKLDEVRASAGDYFLRY